MIAHNSSILSELSMLPAGADVGSSLTTILLCIETAGMSSGA